MILTFYLQRNFKQSTWENMNILVNLLWFFLLCIHRSEISNSSQPLISNFCATEFPGFEISNWMHLSIGQADCKNHLSECTISLSEIYKANASYVKIRNTQSSVGQVLTMTVLFCHACCISLGLVMSVHKAKWKTLYSGIHAGATHYGMASCNTTPDTIDIHTGCGSAW